MIIPFWERCPIRVSYVIRPAHASYHASYHVSGSPTRRRRAVSSLSVETLPDSTKLKSVRRNSGPFGVSVVATRPLDLVLDFKGETHLIRVGLFFCSFHHFDPVLRE
jgi:hypothetical protein